MKNYPFALKFQTKGLGFRCSARHFLLKIFEMHIMIVCQYMKIHHHLFLIQWITGKYGFKIFYKFSFTHSPCIYYKFFYFYKSHEINKFILNCRTMNHMIIHISKINFQFIKIPLISIWVFHFSEALHRSCDVCTVCCFFI